MSVSEYYLQQLSLEGFIYNIPGETTHPNNQVLL